MARGAFGVQFLELDEYTQQRVVRWVYAEDRRLFDRHAQARIPITIRVICRRLLEGVAVEEFAAPSLELSGDELMIVSERVVPTETTLEVELDLGEYEQPFSAKATVAAARPSAGRAHDLHAAAGRARRCRGASPGGARCSYRAGTTPVDWDHGDAFPRPRHQAQGRGGVPAPAAAGNADPAAPADVHVPRHGRSPAGRRRAHPALPHRGRRRRLAARAAQQRPSP